MVWITQFSHSVQQRRQYIAKVACTMREVIAEENSHVQPWAMASLHLGVEGATGDLATLVGSCGHAILLLSMPSMMIECIECCGMAGH